MTGHGFSLHADVGASRRARELVRGWLAARQWPDADSDDLVMAVSEAVSNAAEHAYGPVHSATPADRLVSVVLVQRVEPDGSRRVEAVVADRGSSRPPSPDGRFRGRGTSPVPPRRARRRPPGGTRSRPRPGAPAGRPHEGKAYGAVLLLDVHSRRVVGWSIDSSQTAALATNALSMAIANCSPRPPGGT
jgi:anti-sigma regulatory factor (Ser/Thr protein kinase)